MVSSSDVLRQQLNDKTIWLKDFKKGLLAAENKRVDIEQENLGQLRRVTTVIVYQKLMNCKNNYRSVETEITGILIRQVKKIISLTNLPL